MIIQSKFPLGRIVATTNLLAKIPSPEIYTALHRHAKGDWGDVCEEDRESNEEALVHDSRLMSVYSSQDGTVFGSSPNGIAL